MKQLKVNKLTSILAAGLICLGLAGQIQAQQIPLDELIQRARNAGIEQSELEELQTRAERRGMSDQQLAALIEPAVNLAEENLPADHITQKALEGLSKGVPSSRIVSYIDRMNSSTRQAARIVDPWVEKTDIRQITGGDGGSAPGVEMRNNLIKASSRAITQNIPAESVGQILDDLNNESVLSRTTPSAVVAAISILPDLPGAEQAQIARSFVVRALKGGFNSGELQKLPTALNMALQRSQLPAASILEGVSNQLQGGTPAAQILQNLSNGIVLGGPAGNIPKGLEKIPDQGRGNGGSN